MGAGVPVWVEVELTKRIWRETYGVTLSEAIDNVELKPYERVTGEASYDEPTEENDK
jgi:hypothetical protein